MTDLFAARSQMAMSLAFHIIFAVVGIGMPLLMVLAERRYLKRGDPGDLDLAKRWSKGTAIMFAVGAVSGTVLSFELGLLWPEFMAFAGPIIGLPFSMEGFAFFLEAIFLGIYLYGWNRISPTLHWWSGVGVMVSGALSGIFVVTANGWMNTPTGFEMVDGQVTSVDPVTAMLNPAAFTQALHMTLAAFATIGFAVAGIHAALLLRRPDSVFHRRAISLALPVGAVFAFLMPISGDLSAKHVAEYQPVKLAAMEALFETQSGAPLLIGGIVDEEAQTIAWGIEVPGALSFLAFSDFNAEVRGLNEFPKEDHPPVAVLHYAFQVMVGAGFAMMAVGAFALLFWWRRRVLPTHPWFLRVLVACSPLGFIAVEAGWTVTEVGRQPWVVQGIMRTADAVTPMPGLVVPFLAMSALYFVLGVVVIVMLKRHVFAAELDEAAGKMPQLDPAEVQP